MFCPKCGTELPNGSKFCGTCGSLLPEQPRPQTPPDRQAAWSAQWNTPAPEPAPTTKKKPKAPVWQIVLVIVGALVVLSLVGKLISSLGKNSSDGNDTMINTPFGNINIPANRDEEDEDDGENNKSQHDISEYRFIAENYYACHPKFGGNKDYVLRFYDITETSISIEYYSHDLVNYGSDRYDHDFTTCTMKYDEEKNCYTFEFSGYWRLYKQRLEYIRYENKRSYGEEFSKVDPVIPEEDFWWYETAKMQTGNYGTDSAVDISQTEVGDIITFGKCEMDNDTSNGLEDITWRVIDKNENGIMVISEYCIAPQETTYSYGTWETSVAREWLNGEFYDNAFTSDEKNKILTSTVVNEDNADTETDGGNDTFDKLFLLSIDEVNKYFPTENARIAYQTLFVQASLCENDVKSSWWLRTPGELDYDRVCQSYVGSNGYVYTKGTTTDVYNIPLRPVMWIAR